MSSTLKEAIEAIEFLRVKKYSPKLNIADKWLGKFKGIVPKRKTSTQYIKELRSTLYGKIKKS